MNVAILTTESETILRDGWKILVDKLGLQKAAQFIVLLECGKGNTIEDIIAYWNDMSIEEIHKRVVTWKSKQQIKQGDFLEHDKFWQEVDSEFD